MILLDPITAQVGDTIKRPRNMTFSQWDDWREMVRQLDLRNLMLTGGQILTVVEKKDHEW